MATEVVVSTGLPSPHALLGPSPQAMLTVAAYPQPADSTRSRVELGGVLVDQINLSGALQQVREFVRSGNPHQIVTVNLDFLSIAADHPEFRATLNAADLAVADGMPLVWLSRIKGKTLAERVAGVDLVTASCEIAAEMDGGVFLLGAGPGVADAAGRKLETLFPGLRIAGTYSPPVGPLRQRDNGRIVEMIRAAAPDFLFVALGAPRQDLWIREHLDQLQVPVAMGVGCVFDILAGSVKRAPKWMQRSGLEWAFRLGQEPQRLWRRYLVEDLPMLARLAWAGNGDVPEAQEALAVGS
jgi:N-acetylglucosaminyldiphosphoundecaprenol N-acetyl-beta-D-mannosaminyltransferase